jgi:4-amino-4-deoxy-L-arabinose transferase-like glycosyltransferase
MKIDAKIIFVLIFIINFSILLLRPFELDESLYMLVGKMILKQRLNPFSLYYSNPFTWIFGSSFVPVIYGFFYIIGGFILTRMVSLTFVSATLILTYWLTKTVFDKNTAKISLIVTGISNTVILLATNALLDSIGIFFFILALYLFYKKKFFYSGISFGLSVLSKFFVILPVFIIFLYLYKKGIKLKRILIGFIILIVPFFMFDFNVLVALFNFFISKHISSDIFTNLIFLVGLFFAIIPLPFLFCLVNIRKSFVRNNYLLVIPFLSIFFFHIITLNYISILHSMPYGLIPLSVIFSKIISNMNEKRQISILFIMIVLNLIGAFGYVFIMPSYSLILNDIGRLNGKILAENPNIVHLIKNSDLNDDYVYNLFYFDFDNDGKSTIEDYENAMKNNFFDYIVVSSRFYMELGTLKVWKLVPKYYCTNMTIKGLRPEMIIYGKCHPGIN